MLPGVSAAELTKGVVIEVVDSDSAFDDLVGGCSLTLNTSVFDGNVHTASCPKTATGVAFTFDYRVKAH